MDEIRTEKNERVPRFEMTESESKCHIIASSEAVIVTLFKLQWLTVVEFHKTFLQIK